MRSKIVLKRCKKQRVGSCRILDLPSHLVYDILCRLTVVSIFSCKCVCKTFLNILTDPHFAQLHLTKGPEKDDAVIVQNRIGIHYKILLIYNNKFELDKPDTLDSNFDSRPCQTLALPTSLSHGYSIVPTIVGSFNGLLCLRYIITNLHDAYYICNPILGEYFALPPSVKTVLSSGFGFCPKTKQYKVLRLMKTKICEIYTLGTDHYWRNIGYVPCPGWFTRYFSCLNGNLHWITESTTIISNLICSFNLETEQFSYISPPAQLTQDICQKNYTMRVGSLGGSLCFSYLLGSQYEVFVMKDYGVDGYWIKEFSISLCHLFKEYHSISWEVNLLNNADLMLECNHNVDLMPKGSHCFFLVCLNLRRGTTRVMIAENSLSQDVISFVPSFISLKDIVAAAAAAAGGNVELVQRKMGHNLWSDKGYPFICWDPPVFVEF